MFLRLKIIFLEDKLMFFNLDKIDMLDGIVRFSEPFFFINIILLLHFFITWVIDYKKTKVKLDYWRSFCILYVIIPILIMYPVSASYINIVSVGTDIVFIDRYVDEAYFISIIGYISMLIGRCLYKKPKTININCLEKIIIKNLSNKSFYNILYSISLCLFIIVILLLYKYPEFLFNGRAVRFINSSLGFILNFILSYIMFSLTFFFLNIWKHKSKLSLVYSIISIFMSILMGSRVILMTPIFMIITMLICFYNKSVKIWHFIIGILSILTMMIILSFLRLPDNDYAFISIIIEILYGNTFSDLRDFAWVLSGFNDDFLFGKTYVSALISFIPSSLISFRETYGIGVITNKFAGIVFEHFGLRTGIFGEAFLNFGYLGVIIIGAITGYLLQKANIFFLMAIKVKKDIYLAYTKTVIFMFISTILLSSVNTFTIYVYLSIHILSYIVSKFYWSSSGDINGKYIK